MHCSGFNLRAARRLPHRQGFTLVEALVGTVLVAAFASSTLLAFRMHNSQLRNADDKLQAVRAADELLESLLSRKGRQPTVAFGLVPGHRDWQWSLTASGQQPLAGATVHVSRFLIFRTEDHRVLVSTDVITNAVPPSLRGAGR